MITLAPELVKGGIGKRIIINIQHITHWKCLTHINNQCHTALMSSNI